jgi:hypothetical protein
MMQNGENTEATIRAIISANYADPDFLHDERLIRHILATLEDENMQEAKGTSSAAAWLRSTLWSTDYASSTADKTTCDIFYALGRESELGWILEGIPDYRFEG